MWVCKCKHCFWYFWWSLLHNALSTSSHWECCVCTWWLYSTHSNPHTWQRMQGLKNSESHTYILLFLLMRIFFGQSSLSPHFLFISLLKVAMCSRTFTTWFIHLRNKSVLFMGQVLTMKVNRASFLLSWSQQYDGVDGCANKYNKVWGGSNMRAQKGETVVLRSACNGGWVSRKTC